MTDYILRPAASRSADDNHLINRLDAAAMVARTNETYYGGHAMAASAATPVDARRRGHNFYLGRPLDAIEDSEVSFTEDTPAVVWARNQRRSVEDWENNFSDRLTFPQYVEAVYYLQRLANDTLEQARVTDFNESANSSSDGDIYAVTPAVANQVLGTFYGSQESADAIAMAILNGILSVGQASKVGPRVQAGMLGLVGSTGAQVLAAASGAVDYRPEGRSPMGVTAEFVPTVDGEATINGRTVRVWGIDHDWDSKAKVELNFPEGDHGWLDDEASAKAALEAVRTGLAMAISVYGHTAAVNSEVDDGDRPNTTAKREMVKIGQFVAAALDTIIQEAGLSEPATALLEKARGKEDYASRRAAVSSFWSFMFGYDGSPDGTFGGLLPHFGAICRGVIDTALAKPQAVSAVVGEDTPALVVKNYRDRGQPRSYKELALDYAFWQKVRDAGAADIATMSLWRVRQVFPPMPMAGECGGVVAVTPTRRRSNHLIKHSRRGTPQECAEAVGSRFMAATDIIQSTSQVLRPEDTDIVDIIDLDLL